MSNTDTNLRALRVISWDDVAASHMRHILNAVGGEHHFYSAQYGVPELAQKSQEQTQKYFARVKQLPFAMTFFKFEPEEQKKVFEAAQDYLLHQPEQVTSWNWDNMKDCVKAPPGKFGLLPADSWFSPALPMGTVYFYDDRHLLNNFKNDVATLTTLKNISPYHEYLCGALARKKYGKNPTPEQYTEVFGRLADYNIGTMKLIAEAAVENPEICIPLEERLTTLEPATYLGLGNYCVLFHRPDQAANYFEKAEVEYDEAVSKSIYSNWLITYRLEHGQKAKAAELAKWCGEVYSYGGLQALGNYLERTGDLPGAEESYKNAVERYNKKNALAAFYVRNASKKKEYAEQALIMTKDTFPGGLRRASAGDFKGPPKEGVKIIEVDTPHAASPFKEGMIIVAVNGYAVGNDAQQKMAAVFSLAHELKATVWDGKGYKDLQRPFANEYNLGVKVENFKGQ